MDWFEQLTGFVESTGRAGYESTHQRLEVDGQRLRSRVNGRQFSIGNLELVSLQSLRERALSGLPVPGPGSLRLARGDVRTLHAQPEYAGALFQVASQFNLLEMVGPELTPEHGVTRYATDPTQGPACAIAAGAATLYRNYFVPVGTATGQTSVRQLDGFADLGTVVAQGLGRTADQLWTMRNGYPLFTYEGINLMSGHVESINEVQRDAIRQRLKIGVHWDVEVTDRTVSPGPLVSQAFCSALPVSYNRFNAAQSASWAPMAALVLEAAYEATLWSAVVNAQRGASRKVLLTLLGGGAFGNDEQWIRAAMQRAFRVVQGHGLEIVIVGYHQPSADLERWVQAQGW
jgi:hypothetical protein